MAGTRRLRKASDREARPAAAAGGGIGIFALDRRSAERTAEMDRAAAHEAEAARTADQLPPAAFGADIAGVVAFGHMGGAACRERECQHVSIEVVSVSLKTKHF